MTKVVEVFKRALEEILSRVSFSGSKPSIAIAYSGGLDSSVLLHVANEYACAHQITLHAFHIHHGISPNADSWLQHCKSECERMGIAFDSRRIRLSNTEKTGIEEAARLGRYAGLGELCRTHNVPLILTAHHQDDQAETVLLQLLRGSGVAGLSGMDEYNAAPDLLGDPTLMIGRPMLALSRAELTEAVKEKSIAYIEDESNLDPRYARNALRSQVMPALANLFPRFQARFARTAQHAQSAQRLLIEFAAQDLDACLDGTCIDIDRLKQLNADRIDNVLRYWFGTRGVRMPSTAWLSEMRSQLLEAKDDAQLCVTHADCHIRRHRNRVYMTPKQRINPDEVQAVKFQWRGEKMIRFASFGGELHFDDAEHGIAVDWLQAQDLMLRFREGGERLKLAHNRPTKSLKYHYQAFDVPAWERTHLPILVAGKELVFAAGIGMDCHRMAGDGERRISLIWKG